MSSGETAWSIKHSSNIIVHYTYPHIPYFVAIVDCIHLEPPKGLGKVTVAHENSTNQTATASFGHSNSFHGAGSPQTNSRTERALPILILIDNCQHNKHTSRSRFVYST